MLCMGPKLVSRFEMNELCSLSQRFELSTEIVNRLWMRLHSPCEKQLFTQSKGCLTCDWDIKILIWPKVTGIVQRFNRTVLFQRFHRIVLSCLFRDRDLPIFVDLASYDMSSGQSWHRCDLVILRCHPHDTASNTLLCSPLLGCQSSDRRATSFATNIACRLGFIMKIVFVGPYHHKHSSFNVDQIVPEYLPLSQPIISSNCFVWVFQNAKYSFNLS